MKCLNFEYFSDKVFLYLSLCAIHMKNLDLAYEIFEKYPKYDDDGMYKFSKLLHEKAYSS